LIRFYFKQICIKYPDAHVNYVDALDYWLSYGVSTSKVFVTRNSPDTEMMKHVHNKIKEMPLLLQINRFRLIHVGRLVQWKQVDLLLRAVEILKKSYSNIELLVIGSGPDENDLKHLAKKLEIDGSVIFLGGVYDPIDLGRYFRESAIYVLAGMGGLSINEAMFYGKPIICSECDGTERFLVREDFNGKYFQVGDLNDLVQKITFLFDRNEDIQRMGENSKKIIEHEVNVRTVVDGYVSALNYVTNQKYLIENNI
jgi:glycosyltransferase involved in cell wall biosynthesis